MKKLSGLKFFGLIIGAIGIGLAFIWFDWKFVLVIFFLMWSNNIGASK